ncbi:MAG: 50S ribosomal protein L24 [Zoogloeaceae bacterium]|jgi:large subunit ribosomal protein L24|nr:50S ribosomal protein L24 [Zoogloeaceae bacterium]
MEKIRKDDEVIVIAGKDKGRRGIVRARVKDGEYLLVEGVNIAKKHVRPNPMRGITGGIVSKEMPIHISNVALFNPATGKADRVRIKVDQVEGGRKKVVRTRLFRSNGELVKV